MSEEAAPFCIDHSAERVNRTCSRCGRFICAQCDSERVLGRCPACAALEVLGPAEGPRGLGGWLVLVAIGLVITPVTLGVGLISQVRFLREAELSTFAFSLVTMHSLLSLALMGATGFAAVRFFGKRKDAPKWMIGLYLAAILITGAQLLLEQLVEPEVSWDDSSPVRELMGATLRAAIWIPYFRLSKRVKATFVRP